MAEAGGFEPPRPCGLSVFKTARASVFLCPKGRLFRCFGGVVCAGVCALEQHELREDCEDELSKKKNTRRQPVVKVNGNPATDSAVACQVHSRILASAVYARALDAGVSGAVKGMDLAESSHTYVDALLEKVGPKDPLEEMLVVQALMAHSRVLHLSELANSQQELISIRVLNEYADRASNTFRRLMLALAEYRRPFPARGAKTSIGQANIAQNQIVVSDELRQTKNGSNEQGFEDAEEAVQPDAGGALGAPSIGQCGGTVAILHGPEDCGGEEQEPNERSQARRKVGADSSASNRGGSTSRRS